MANFKYKIKVTEIHYIPNDEWFEQFEDKDDDWFYSDEYDNIISTEIDKISKPLPKEFEFEVECDYTDLSLYDMICNKISDETNQEVNSCNFKIVEEKII